MLAKNMLKSQINMLRNFIDLGTVAIPEMGNGYRRQTSASSRATSIHASHDGLLLQMD